MSFLELLSLSVAVFLLTKFPEALVPAEKTDSIY